MIELKNIELHLFTHRERKNIFLLRLISSRQRGAVMAFIPDLRKGREQDNSSTEQFVNRFLRQLIDTFILSQLNSK